MHVFSSGVDKDTVVLMAARASKLENQDAIDTAIVSMLIDHNKDSPGGPWELVSLLPLFYPPRYDSTETIRRAFDLEFVSR
ncbi:putative P-type ATPase, cytoplasmic domain N [Helianthus anomalus]